MVREGGLEPPRPEWTLEPESAEVFDLCYGFCFPLRCCRFWQPRLDFPNTALDCGIFAIYILIIASDFGEGKEFFFKNRQVRSNFIETGKELYSSLTGFKATVRMERTPVCFDGYSSGNRLFKRFIYSLYASIALLSPRIFASSSDNKPAKS